jgi:hypothetical protein
MSQMSDSDFKKAYAKLIRAIWQDGDTADKVKKDPSKLKDYGFSDIPDSVDIVQSKGPVSSDGLKEQQDDYNKGGKVELRVPPKPDLKGAGPQGDGISLCCCCCPCCTA